MIKYEVKVGRWKNHVGKNERVETEIELVMFQTKLVHS